MISKQQVSDGINEETVLRRVFALCFLHTVEYATYRLMVNTYRTNECPTAMDYVITDYNYVCIKRKALNIVFQAIVDQQGPQIPLEVIRAMVMKWRDTMSDTALPSYQFDHTKGCLVSGDIDDAMERPLVIIDNCPRNTKTERVCFLIAFLKERLPDLMGDSKVANLLPSPINAVEVVEEVPKINTFNSVSCIRCYDAQRGCIFMPCHHVLLCRRCSGIMKPEICLVCRAPVKTIEDIYVS